MLDYPRPTPAEAMAAGGPEDDGEALLRRLLAPLMDLAAEYQEAHRGKREIHERFAFAYVLKLRDMGFATTAELEERRDG